MADRSPLTARQRAAIVDVVGGPNALVDDDLRAGYEVDWTGRWRGRCAMVVRPGDTGEVSAVVAFCDSAGIDVVTQGGNTGLVGAGVPRDVTRRPAIVLSTRRLRRLEAVDADVQQVTAGAGVTIAEWQTAARAAGFDTPIDFAARESATIGGAIATNAGGSRVLRYGTMRQQVLGIEAVLADGSTVGSLAGLPKETVGVHWPTLFSGSEGTLGVVTTARLRVVPRYDAIVSALVSVTDLEAAIELLGTLRRRLDSLDAVELLLPDAMELVAAHLGRPSPVEPGAATLLVECAAHDDPTDGLLEVLAQHDGIVDTAVATDRSAREQLAAFRDRMTESIAAEATAIGTPTYKLDVAVPLGSLPHLMTIASRAAHDVGGRLIPFGHLAEGNVHLNYLGATDVSAIANAVLPAVAELGGTISAEHGVGVAKAPWLPLVRSARELVAFAALRRALDPNGILNPGVLDPSGQVP